MYSHRIWIHISPRMVTDGTVTVTGVKMVVQSVYWPRNVSMIHVSQDTGALFVAMPFCLAISIVAVWLTAQTRMLRLSGN